MYPHPIRLRGPWEIEPLVRFLAGPNGHVERQTVDLPPACRMRLPCRWDAGGLADFAGKVRYRRGFGLPRRLDVGEQVFLIFSAVEGRAAVWLNKRPLGQRSGTEAPFEFEVGPLLRSRNELLVEVESPRPDGGLWGEVTLEVRAAAFLRGVQVLAARRGAEGRLIVRGEVVGVGGPLDLYVLLEDRTLATAAVTASAAGQPFEVVVADVPLGSDGLAAQDGPVERRVRVELVNAATVWYTVDLAAVWHKVVEV